MFKKKVICFRIDVENYSKIKSAAKIQKRSVSSLIAYAASNYADGVLSSRKKELGIEEAK